MDPLDKNIPSGAKDYSERLFTFEEYLALEDKSDYKSEYERGKIIELSGGTFKHSRISVNMSNAIQNNLKTKKKQLPGYR